jgi:hypothetical protein
LILLYLAKKQAGSGEKWWQIVPNPQITKTLTKLLGAILVLLMTLFSKILS